MPFAAKPFSDRPAAPLGDRLRRPARGWRGWLAIGLPAVYLAANAPRAASIAGFMLRLPRAVAGESAAAARERLFGAPYCRSIDELRRVLPADRPYLLVAGDSPGSGATYWVRYDLAPRPALYLGQLDRLTPAAWQRLDGMIPSPIQQVVVACSRAPARLLERSRFGALVAAPAVPPGAGPTPPMAGDATAPALAAPAAAALAAAVCAPQGRGGGADGR